MISPSPPLPSHHLAHEQPFNRRLHIAAGKLQHSEIHGPVLEAHVMQLLQLNDEALFWVLRGASRNSSPTPK